MILAHHIDKLYRDEQITWQRKNKFIERLNTLFSDNFDLPKVNNVEDYVRLSREIILKTFEKGDTFHNNVLTDVRQGERKRMVRRCKDPTQLSKAAKYWERIRVSYKKSLCRDYALMFGKYVETLHYTSSIYFTVRLTATSTGLLFVILERSVTVVQKWLRATMLKFMDMLKRQRLLSDAVEQSFQKVFTRELKQCIDEIMTRKKEIIESEETKSLSLYLQEMVGLKETYTKLLIIQSYISMSSNEDIRFEMVPTQKIIDKFSVCSQYAHASEVAAQNANLSFARYSHTLLLEGISQPLNTFITRMKHHTDRIFQEEVSKFARESRNELNLKSAFDQINGILSNMDLKFDEIFNRLTDILTENLGTVEEAGLDFQLFYNGLIKRRRSKMRFLVNKMQLLFRTIVKCHCPISWKRSIRHIEKAPTMSISACCEQNLYMGLFDDYDFSNLVKKCSSKSFLILISSIMKKFEVLNDGIIEEIMDNHDSAMHYVNEFEPGITKSIKQFQKKTFLTLFYQVKQFKRRELMLHTTCTFLNNILSSIEGTIEKDKDLMDTLVDYAEKITKLVEEKITEQKSPTYTLADGMLDATKIQGSLNISQQRLSRNPNLDVEEKEASAEDVKTALENYVAICKTLYVEEAESAPEETHSMLTFDYLDANESFNAIGNQYQFLNDRSIRNGDIMRESWEVLHLLWRKSFISREQIYSYMRDLTFFSHDDYQSACKTIMEMKVGIKDVIAVMMITIGRKKAKRLWAKLFNALSATSKLNKINKLSNFERVVLR